MPPWLSAKYYTGQANTLAGRPGSSPLHAGAFVIGGLDHVPICGGRQLVGARGHSVRADRPRFPFGAASPFITKFVHTPLLLLMLFEDVPGFRQIFLDGRSHPSDVNPTWMAHSIGKWEGDTLVVDTVGFHDRSWIGVYPHTEMLHMIERYRRVDFGHLEVLVTFEDPGAFTKPWNMNLTWDLAPQEELLEFVCENNKTEHLVGK